MKKKLLLKLLEDRLGHSTTKAEGKMLHRGGLQGKSSRCLGI